MKHHAKITTKTNLSTSSGLYNSGHHVRECVSDEVTPGPGVRDDVGLHSGPRGRLLVRRVVVEAGQFVQRVVCGELGLGEQVELVFAWKLSNIDLWRCM